MVLYLKPGDSAQQDGINITSVSYSIILLDTCIEYHVKTKYKNTSPLPISLKFENDNRDFGTLYYLECVTVDPLSESKIFNLFDVTEINKNFDIKSSGSTKAGSSGAISDSVRSQIKSLKESNYSQSILSSAVSGGNTLSLLPEKEIQVQAKYFKVLEYTKHISTQIASNSDLIEKTNVKFDLPTPVHPGAGRGGTIDLQVECEFPLPVKSISCESHPSLVAGTFTLDTTSKAVYHVPASQIKEGESLAFNIELANGHETFTGYYSTSSLNENLSDSTRGFLTSSSQPPFIMSRVITVHSDLLAQDQLTADWSSCGDNQAITKHKVEKGSMIYSMVEYDELNQYKSSHNLGSISNTSNNVLLKYNQNNNEFNLQLKKTKFSSVLNRYIAMLKLLDYNTESEAIHLSTLLKLFFQVSYSELLLNNDLSYNGKSKSPLSQSAPDIKKQDCNINNTLSSDQSTNSTDATTASTSTTTGESISSVTPTKPSLPTGKPISNLLANLPKKNLLNPQSLTAPPSVMNKEPLGNPIADFIAHKQAMGTSTGPKSVKKGPPPKLGASQPGATSDIRLQRLASYTKVNQMWNLSRSDLAERHTISLRELEPFALDCALYHIKSNWWKPNRQATLSEIQLLRSIICNIIHSNQIEITYVNTKVNNNSNNSNNSNSGSTNDLSKLLAASTASTSNTSEEDDNSTTIKEVDPTKLKWIVENILESKKDSFTALTVSNSPSWYGISAFEAKGVRPHMEDKLTVLEYPSTLYGREEKAEKDQVFVGVFDGHNGKICAEFSRVNLPYEIYNSANGANVSEDSLKRGFNETDKYYLEFAEREDKKAGSTAATVILERDEFYVSNVGDTEVVLCSDGIAKPLSTKHNPSLESEKERVESLGGSIIFYGTLRVNGVLSVTRSIGDKHLKEYVCSDPAYLYHKIEKKDQFLVLATDGLWEVFTYQEVVEFILTGKFNNSNNSSNNILTASTDSLGNISNNCNSNDSSSSSSSSINSSSGNKDDSGEPQQQEEKKKMSLSEQLTEEAIRRNTKDNVTVVIIFLKENYQPIDE